MLWNAVARPLASLDLLDPLGPLQCFRQPGLHGVCEDNDRRRSRRERPRRSRQDCPPLQGSTKPHDPDAWQWKSEV